MSDLRWLVTVRETPELGRCLAEVTLLLEPPIKSSALALYFLIVWLSNGTEFFGVFYANEPMRLGTAWFFTAELPFFF